MLWSAKELGDDCSIREISDRFQVEAINYNIFRILLNITKCLWFLLKL